MQTQFTSVLNDRAETIALKSPEGAAANPQLGSGTIHLLALMLPVSALMAATVVWGLFGAPLAFVTLTAGLILTIGMNPTLWAIMLRAKERKEIEQDSTTR